MDERGDKLWEKIQSLRKEHCSEVDPATFLAVLARRDRSLIESIAD
jgi:hypothetical protein